MIKITTEAVEEKEAIRADIEFHEMRDLQQFLFEITAAAAKIRQTVTDLMPEGLRQKTLEMLAKAILDGIGGTQEGEDHD